MAGKMFPRLLAAAFALLACPAAAQVDPAADLDALSAQSETGTGGLVLARNQSETGDLLGALGTLDRVLMADPASKPALLLRAGLLCRIDDRQGGNAQLARLKKRDFSRDDWARASAACAVAKTSGNSAPVRRNDRWKPHGY